MAKQSTILKFTGRLGGVIGYIRNGVHCIRTAPETVKQSAATRKASKDFGQASKTARMLRHAIETEVSSIHDRGVNNRLNKVMASVLRADFTSKPGRRKVTVGNLQQLNGFRWNKHAGIRTNVTVQRTFDGGIAVTCADPLLQFPAQATQVQFRVIALLPDFALGGCSTVVSPAVMLTREQASQPLVLQLPVPAGQMAIVLLEAVAYRLFAGRLLPMGGRQYNAADIVAVLPGKKVQGRHMSHYNGFVDAGVERNRYRDIRIIGNG